jgi:hypothetical protein
MSLSDLKHLKDLSWYTTVPLLVCAWIIQDKALSDPASIGTVAFAVIVGFYFLKVVFYLLCAYAVWLFASVHVEPEGLPLTLLLATFLLTLAFVGIVVRLNGKNTLPVNIFWFFAFGSVAFNLYQIHSGVLTANAKRKNSDGSDESS